MAGSPDWMLKVGKPSDGGFNDQSSLCPSDETFELLSKLPQSAVYTCTKCADRHPAEWRTALERELQGCIRNVLNALLNSRTSAHLLRYKQVRNTQLRFLDGVSMRECIWMQVERNAASAAFMLFHLFGDYCVFLVTGGEASRAKPRNRGESSIQTFPGGPGSSGPYRGSPDSSQQLPSRPRVCWEKNGSGPLQFIGK